MQNIITGIDLLGTLIADRETGEELDEYADRMGQVAEQLTTRNLAAPGDEWVRAREKELEGRLNAPTTLRHAPGDNELAERANEKLSPESLLGEAPIRWPDYPASGDPPMFNWTYPENGGVASPGVLKLQEDQGQVAVSAGFVSTPRGIGYVPADPVRLHFHLPPGTKKTVILPWQIVSDHPHRIEVIDETTLKFIASDHEHTATRTEEGFGLDGPHDHKMFPADVSGPCFPRTRPGIPTTSQESFGETIPPDTKPDGWEHMPLPVPILDQVEAETDDGEHKTAVDPFDYWSGDFVFVGDNHVHRVVDYTVREADGHSHPFTEPTPPADRGLIPHFNSIGGVRLAAPEDHAYALNLSIEEGWLVGSSPEPLSPLLELVFDRSSTFGLPRLPGEAGDVIGIGPDLDPSRISLRHEGQAIAGSPTQIRLAVLDAEGALQPHEPVVLATNSGDRFERMTDSAGRADVFVTPPAGIGTLRVTAELKSDASVSNALEIGVFDEEGVGYGMSYGIDYGK